MKNKTLCNCTPRNYKTCTLVVSNLLKSKTQYFSFYIFVMVFLEIILIVFEYLIIPFFPFFLSPKWNQQNTLRGRSGSHGRRKLPSRFWKLAHIVQLYSSDYGLIRSAKILTPNGNELIRSLNKLFLLEIQATDYSINDKPIPPPRSTRVFRPRNTPLGLREELN